MKVGQGKACTILYLKAVKSGKSKVKFKSKDVVICREEMYILLQSFIKKQSGSSKIWKINSEMQVKKCCYLWVGNVYSAASYKQLQKGTIG